MSSLAKDHENSLASRAKVGPRSKSTGVASDRRARQRRTAARAASLAGDLRDRGRRRQRSIEKVESGEFALARSDGAVADAEADLEARLRTYMATGRVSVTLTDNRFTMLSVRRGEDRGVDSQSVSPKIGERAQGGAAEFSVRLHHMFAAASSEVTEALARYISHDDKSASAILGDFIDSNQHRVRPDSPRKTSEPMTKGICHDLQTIFDDLNQSYFGGNIEASIRWGQRCGKAQRRNSIKMGSYSIEDQAIRIHRSLDKAWVPRFFVEWIVYHEMLHQVHQAPLVNGRRQFHSKEFLADEAKFEHYTLASLWEREHLEQLLVY